MKPLHWYLRPKTIQEYIGQKHLLGEHGPLWSMLSNKQLLSMVLWGPPGTGKTSLAKLLTKEVGGSFHTLDATSSSVKDLRGIIQLAKVETKQVVIFVDELHRFNKAQQDVLLPVVEDGTIVLIGATTENPKFAVNSTILSRSLTFELFPHSDNDMLEILGIALRYLKSVSISSKSIKFDKESIKLLINKCSGDARKMLMVVELAAAYTDTVTTDIINNLIPSKHLVFNAHGNDHFDLAHCYQESIQNSDPDSAIYWLAKWILSGEDPAYICRRMMISAYEDCADSPHALTAAVGACLVTERTGLPECQIAMATATIIMAQSKRNKTGYFAIKAAMNDINNGATVHVPNGMRAGESGYIPMAPNKYVKSTIV